MKKQKFGFTGSSDRLQKTSVKLGQWWYIAFAATGSAVLSISSSFVGSYGLSEKWSVVEGNIDTCSLLFFNPWAFIFYGVLAIIYGGNGTYRDQKNLNIENEELKKDNVKVGRLKERVNSVSEDSEALQNQLSELQVKLVTTWLKGCSKQLHLKTHDRVSIYYCIGDHFYVLARHSQNPKFAEIHRQKFSKNHGVISEAWEHKVCVDVEGIPSYKSDPDAYKTYMFERYGYQEEKTAALTMKSCQYVATSIAEADNPIGVIIFESEQLGKFKSQKVSQIKRYCSEHQSYMVDFIRDGIKYNKSAKVVARGDHDVDHEFISKFKGGGEI